MGKIVICLGIVVMLGFLEMSEGHALDGVQKIFAGLFGLYALYWDGVPLRDRTLMDGLGYIFLLIGGILGAGIGVLPLSLPPYIVAGILLFRPPAGRPRGKYWLFSGLAFIIVIGLLIALMMGMLSPQR